MTKGRLAGRPTTCLWQQWSSLSTKAEEMAKKEAKRERDRERRRAKKAAKSRSRASAASAISDGDAEILIEVQQENPKKPGSLSFERYEAYKV